MAATTFSSFDPTPAEARRLNRTIKWSIAVHLVAIVAIVATPRSWWRSTPEPRTVMTINLGGSPGPSSTGQTSLGGRTVEQIAPPPPRPEPARPTTPAPPAPTSAPAVRAQPPPPTPAPPTPKPTPPPRPTTTTRPQAEAPRVTGRAPVTGTQPSQGSTRVETGARGQGAGLSFGGGVSGGETDLSNFCCPEYLRLVEALIYSRWNSNFPEQGMTRLELIVRRDGSLSDIRVTRSSGYSTLDRAARSAVEGLSFPPLPAAYTNQELRMYFNFPYGAL